MNMYQGLEQLKTYLELFKKERINYDKLKEASKEFSALLAFVSLHLETPKETHKKRQFYFCLSPSFFNKFKHNINHHNRLNIRIKYFIAYLLDIFLLLYIIDLLISKIKCEERLVSSSYLFT